MARSADTIRQTNARLMLGRRRRQFFCVGGHKRKVKCVSGYLTFLTILILLSLQKRGSGIILL